MPSRDPEPRAPLSGDRVLRAAVELADRGGVESLSMRKLASALGYEVMSLYNHVANKDEVLDGILDLIAAEIEPPLADPDWKAAMRRSVLSAHEVLVRHPWAVNLWSSRSAGPNRLAFMESLLRGLREGGFSPAIAYHGYHAVTMHILGFTLQELNLPFDRANIREVAAESLRTLPAEQYPYLAEHITQHVEEPDHDADFDFVLDLILDGLERAGHSAQLPDGERRRI